MTANEKSRKSAIYIQYAFIGAALGLYYGLFYKPAGDPDFGIAVILSVVAAFVTVLIRSWKKGFTFIKIMKDFFVVMSFFLIFMLSLVFRQTAFRLGGQLAVVIETTVVGIGLGLLMAWRKVTVAQGQE